MGYGGEICVGCFYDFELEWLEKYNLLVGRLFVELVFGLI